ncbi:MAG: sugar transferase [Planctomycetota bacterium]
MARWREMLGARNSVRPGGGNNGTMNGFSNGPDACRAAGGGFAGSTSSDIARTREHQLYGAEQFRSILHKERSRADRLGDELSLVCMPGLSSLDKDQQYYLSQRLRCTDDAGWLAAGWLGVLLPHTGKDCAYLVADNLCQEFGLNTEDAIVLTYPTEKLPDGHVSDGCENEQSVPEQRQAGNRSGVAPTPTTAGNAKMPSDAAHAPRLNSVVSGNTRKTGKRRRQDSHEQKSQADSFGKNGATESVRSNAAPKAGRSAAGANDDLLVCTDLLVLTLPWWKRSLDICGSILGLIALSPVFLITAIAIKVNSRGPVFFAQRRVGAGGRIFRMFKFRSMVPNAEALKASLSALNEATGPVFKSKRDPRITGVGRWIRKTSIDELPQLLNVLLGDMSLVGPRPPTPDEVAIYSPWQRRRLELTPGLTCIWQVHGRCQVEFEDWVRMDLQYAARRSVWLDLKLIFGTIPAVLFMRGAH